MTRRSQGWDTNADGQTIVTALATGSVTLTTSIGTVSAQSSITIAAAGPVATVTTTWAGRA